MLNFDFWDKEWPVITGAPHLVIGGVVALIIVVFLIVRWGYSRQVAGQKAEIAALNERLRLAADEQAVVSRQVTTVNAQVARLEEQIARQEALTVLADTASQVHGTVGDLSLANSTLGRTLSHLDGRYRLGTEVTRRSDK